MLYQLLAGKTPFNGEDKTELFNAINAHKDAPLEYPANISEDVKDLIERLLTMDPQRRSEVASFSALKAHPFFEGIQFEELHKMASPPRATRGQVAATEIEAKLRQRKYSMMLTKTIPRKYQYLNFGLSIIYEVNEEEEERRE